MFVLTCSTPEEKTVTKFYLGILWGCHFVMLPFKILPIVIIHCSWIMQITTGLHSGPFYCGTPTFFYNPVFPNRWNQVLSYIFASLISFHLETSHIAKVKWVENAISSIHPCSKPQGCRDAGSCTKVSGCRQENILDGWPVHRRNAILRQP